MKIRTVGFAALAAVVLGGCVAVPVERYDGAYGRSYGYESEGILVDPPAPRYEYVGPPPVVGYFWIDGYWGWAGRRYVWVPGRWEAPRRDHVWVPHRWERDGRQWREAPGRWERREERRDRWERREDRRDGDRWDRRHDDRRNDGRRDWEDRR